MRRNGAVALGTEFPGGFQQGEPYTHGPMRIALDATALLKAHRTGVARYVSNLVRALAVAAPEDEFVLCYRLSRFSRRRYRIPPPSPRFSARWIQGGWPGPRGIDVAHGPDARLLRLPGARAVTTVHDVFSLESAEFAREGFRKRKRKRYREIARSSHRILCVSAWTRDAFLRHLPVPAERVVVVPEGVEEAFRPEAAEGTPALRARYGIEGPYAVFVGQLSLRKNIRGLLRAWEGMPRDAPRLVLAGPISHGHEDLEEEVERRGLSGRVILTGYFPEGDIPALLAGAECLVFPSFLEGFGLPALEAMACGIPVVCSDRGALPETTAGIRVPVEPEDPASIREGVLRVLSDEELRADLRRRGLLHAARHRWSEVAIRTLRVYREAAE